MLPFGSDDTPTQYEENTRQLNEVLMSGDHIFSFEATQPLSRRQAVKIVDDRAVGACDSIDELYGIALYDAAEGEEVAVVERPAMVRVRGTNAIKPGSGVTLSDSTLWKRDDSYREVAIVHASNEDNCMLEVELRPR